MDTKMRSSYIENNFYLPLEIIESLEKYYILHWTGLYTIQNIQENNGRILREDVLYKPEISNLFPRVSFKTLHQIRQVAISFRKEKNILSGFAIIKPIYKIEK